MRTTIRQASVFLATLILFSACQTKPTKTGSSRVRSEVSPIVAKSEAPLVLNELTVVLDVRSNFDFGLNHVLNSYHFPWTNLAEKESTGELMRDLRKAGLRLSLIGVTPLTPIIIVGNGPAGQGEEGRLAWQLVYYGFRDVQTATIETFRPQLTQQTSPPAQNVQAWTAVPVESLVITKPEFLTLARDPKGRLASKTHILDVRNEQEYIRSKHPDFQSVNIDWKQFFTNRGRPNHKLKARLMALGILPGHRVIVLSQRGVRSAAAAYALTAMGFENVQNFAGGWNAL